MPQMKPILWLIHYLMLLISFLLLYSNNFFIMSNKISLSFASPYPSYIKWSW